MRYLAFVVERNKEGKKKQLDSWRSSSKMLWHRYKHILLLFNSLPPISEWSSCHLWPPWHHLKAGPEESLAGPGCWGNLRLKHLLKRWVLHWPASSVPVPSTLTWFLSLPRPSKEGGRGLEHIGMYCGQWNNSGDSDPSCCSRPIPVPGLPMAASVVFCGKKTTY